ncbi:hypothetical protein Cni_G02453 [Canna indica]|uniref:Protein kinase domain-containing protein n=1 Tax=Canna indica TaxID=4628 RepID=A0AAQ3JR85_9LILI|nr:hypothetical protein Cni_G02453 [Canna indica]
MAVGIHELGLIIAIIISIQWVCYASIPTITDNYLIDCGSSISTNINNRNFVADSSLSSILTTPTDILASTTLNPGSSSGMSALYKTARIFTGPSSYSFSINEQGRHFVRLYFFPFVHGDYNMTTATFSVSTQDVLLLNNFQPPVNLSMKEFSLDITRDNLIISFAPSGSSSFAFVNAIEVISVPDDVFRVTATTVRTQTTQELSGQALETVYRLNVGGQQVLPNDDSLWRTWERDAKFLEDGSRSKNFTFSGAIYFPPQFPTDTAPEIVYKTVRELAPANNSDAQIKMTWKLDVDPNFGYLMRFHFCDVVSAAPNMLEFNVSVNRWPILTNFELDNKLFTALATAYYTDFLLDASDASNQLLIDISPSTPNSSRPIPPNGILNGLEIMKINFSIGSVFVVTPTDSKKNLGIILGSVIGSLAIVIVVVVVVLFLVFRRRRPTIKKYSGTWTPFSIDDLNSHSSADRTSIGTAFTSEQNGNLGYRFPFFMLQVATNNFDESWLIGIGGFGKVYKGVLKDKTKVAVKRGNTKHKQGLKEFHNEIELLSRLRHRHLVSLIGYCDEKNEMILVYEYMEKGTLKSHLYGSTLPSLSWKQRLEICIGSARGLHYLHTSSATAIIHRDVKSANILLDENFLAKVSDFGLSKIGPEMDQTHVSTAVKGSFGYLDPEYFRRQKLTEKSDVYSFGVVLLEVICARPVIDPTLPREMVNLAEWGMKWQKKGELGQIVDPRIVGTIRPSSLRKFGETIEKCLADYGAQRPLIGDVLWNLEYTLQLQEADSDISEINSVNRIPELSPVVRSINASEDGTAEFNTSTLNDFTDASMDKVFSQLINSEGR